ncbi:steroid receptor RNA activator 1 [Lepeophtheirus salmonis]|uniref:steroid receptor RNA activator 1 n=1 Tax=Lepeophtheirus salmonis TaxID=72036 RepID=UPI001AE671BB|nr:steroid receptor RNA activator 1-like [Lepeophtheirus salmonis]
MDSMDSVIKEGSHDVAWNDPPQFAYNPGSTDRRKLTQRIGMSQYGEPIQSAVGGIPNPARRMQPSPNRALLEDDKNAPVPDLNIVSQGFKALLYGSQADDKRKRDVIRRIEMMETKWSSGGLNDNVMRGCGKILDLLTKASFDDALKVQTRLSVDWPGLVNPWAVGIKQLILLLSQQQV